MSQPRSPSALLPTGLVALVFLSPCASATPRFEARGTIDDRAVDWVSLDGPRIAFGHDDLAVLVEADGRQVELRLDFAVETAILSDDVLLAASRRGGLVAVRLAPDAVPLPTESVPGIGVVTALARMDDHLVVAEQGYGLRWLALALPAAHRQAGNHCHAADLREIASVPLERDVTALAVTGRRVLVATRDGALLAIDAQRLDELQWVGLTEGLGDVRALAADGSTLYLLDDAGLRIVDLDGPSRVEDLSTRPRAAATREGGRIHDPAVRLPIEGQALEVAGRRLVVAGPRGVETWVDVAPRAVIHPVSVGDFSFTPANLTVAVGDTVRWTNNAGTHNVESCDGAGDPAQCMGQVAADGLFRSGNPTAAAFVFDHTFVNVGQNRYFCSLHVGFNMLGNVQVTAPPPPPVPDGSPGSPLVVSKTVPSGSTLGLNWDATSCTGNANHQVIFGFGASLPSTLGGTYTPSGSRCAVGFPPFAWTAVPDPAPDPDRLLWFLVLATNGSNTEGSWGTDGAGAERNGPGFGGASGQCVASKNTTNTCP